MRGFTVLSAVAALLTVVVGNAREAVSYSYTVTELGSLGDQYSPTYAEDINNNGQVVGTSKLSGNDWNMVHAFLYSGNGPMQDIGTLGGGVTHALGINDAGQIVGCSAAFGSNRAFLYSGGVMQDLGTLPGAFGSGANAINGIGQIVGTSNSAFRTAPNRPIDLTTTLLGPGTPYAINDSGQTVGMSGSRAVLYSDGGAIEDLGTFGGPTGHAFDINNDGQIVGMADTSEGVGHAFLCNGSGPLQDLNSPGWTSSRAEAINNNGWVVGYGAHSGYVHAFLWNGGGDLQDLNDLIDPASGWGLVRATSINDSGQVVGIGYSPAAPNIQRAFLLTPIPEPRAFSLLSVGTIVLLGYIGRHRWTRNWRR
jgi:probable HAF family extracellular repeat protein